MFMWRFTPLVFLTLLLLTPAVWSAASLAPRAIFSVLYDKKSLYSTNYTYCLQDFELGGVPSTVCATGRQLLIHQLVRWGTVIPPGIYPMRNPAIDSVGKAQFFCTSYQCDMTALLPLDASVTSVNLSDAFGGFGVATPCCGSTYNTFLFFSTNLTIVQLRNFSLEAINAQVQSNINDYFCKGDSLCESVPTSKVLVKLLNPRTYPLLTTFSSIVADGGIIFPVKVSICGHSLSSVFSYDDTALLTYGYSAVFAMGEHVESVSFPWELIRYITSWINVKRGDATVSLLWSKQCSWKKEEDEDNFYRTGEYLECYLEENMVGNLPFLSVEVERDRIISVAPDGVDEEGVFSLDLNRLVDENGILRLYSTGSITQARQRKALYLYREPLLVIGSLFVEGGVYGVTRQLVSSSNPKSDLVFRDLPLFYLAGPYFPVTEDQLSGETAVCMARRECSIEEVFFLSLNTCGSVVCATSFGYVYDRDTMTCHANAKTVAVFVLLFVLCAVGEGLVIWNRRRVRAKERAHMRLIELIQRTAK